MKSTFDKSPTQERLMELFDYNQNSGVLTRKVSVSRNTSVGDVAGTKDSDGYRKIRIDGMAYQEHRIIWLYVYGVWPVNEIDHIDGVYDNNRISNLREATRSQNGMNMGFNSNNSSGFKGVTWDKRDRKWRAQIGLNGKIINLGLFETAGSASDAYNVGASKLFGCFKREPVLT